MLNKFCSELQNFHSESIETREKCHSIGVKIHDNFLDEHHLEHKYFYQELSEKNTFERIKHAPKILKDKLFLKSKSKKLQEKKNLFVVRENIRLSNARVVWW